MPTYRVHLLSGIMVWAVLVMCLYTIGCSITQIACGELLLWSALGSLFPDIDTKSKIQRVSYCLIGMVLVCCLVSGRHKIAGYLGLISLLPLVVNHRSCFHRGWFILGIVGMGYAIAMCMFPMARRRVLLNALFFLGGAISHLALDGGWRMVVGR